MGNKSFNPRTASLRWTTLSDFAEIQPKNKRPEKSLTEHMKRTGGRNAFGGSRYSRARSGVAGVAVEHLVDVRPQSGGSEDRFLPAE